MKNFIKFLILGFIILGVLPAAGKEKSVEKNYDLLRKLDEIINNHQYHIELKDESLRRLKESLRKAKTEQERLSILRMIYDSYLVYNADSALKYVNQIEHILQNQANPDYSKIAGVQINQAYIYGILGLFADADRIMSRINPAELNSDTKLDYFITDQYISSMKMAFFAESHAQGEEFNGKAVSLLDSLDTYRSKSNSDYVWVPVAAYAESWEEKSEPAEADVKALKNYIDKVSHPSREAAINAYWMSRYYKKKGDEENMVRYLIISATNDALIENREVAAIHELANYLFEHGELERAYNYFTYSTELATTYQNRNRMISISNMFPSVRNAYMAEINKRDRNLTIITIALGLATLLLVMAYILLVNRMRKLKQARAELKELNTNLNGLNNNLNDTIATLEATNNDLQEANTVKRGMISLAFKLTSDYIVDFDDFRNKVLKRFTMKKYDEVKSQLMDPQIIEDMYADFYKNFDKTVISIFPNFVEEYNSLVDDESKVSVSTIEKTKTLNTRMRIYALKRLGIEKSGQIAKILNISIRTVYNNKL